MDLASDYSRDESDSKLVDPPIGYINSEGEPESPRNEQLRESSGNPDGRQSDGALIDHMQSRFQALLPMLTSTSRTERSPRSASGSHSYPSGSFRDGNARFARAPSSSGVARNRGGAPPAVSSPREPPQRRDSVLTASEASFVSATPSTGQQDQPGHSQDGRSSEQRDMPYRRPGKHRIGESPTPEEYMALPPEAKKKVDNRLSARRSRAKRKEHVHVLSAQITEQQNTIEMLRIENKQLNDHIANLSRAGYSLHPPPPPFQPGLHTHPSPHLRHMPAPPSHMHAPGRHPSVRPPSVSHLPDSPHRGHPLPSPTLSAHPSTSSGLVAAAAPPTGPGHVPILGHGVALASRSEASGSYVTQGHGGARYDSPGRGTKREVDDDVDDRLRARARYTSPERMSWDRDSEGRRMSHSSYRSPSRSVDYHHSHHPKQVRAPSRSPSPQPRWEHLPPSLAATAVRHDPAEEVFDHRTPIQISGQGLFSDRLATLVRVHKRAILTYQDARRGHLSEREEERMEGVLVAAEAIGKEVEELTDEFHYVGRQDAD